MILREKISLYYIIMHFIYRRAVDFYLYILCNFFFQTVHYLSLHPGSNIRWDLMKYNILSHI